MIPMSGHFFVIDIFIRLMQDMARGSEEHSLEFQELFNEYLVIFEGKLEEFIGE